MYFIKNVKLFIYIKNKKYNSNLFIKAIQIFIILLQTLRAI